MIFPSRPYLERARMTRDAESRSVAAIAGGGVTRFVRRPCGGGWLAALTGDGSSTTNRTQRPPASHGGTLRATTEPRTAPNRRASGSSPGQVSN
ncbi:hypothetical protein LSAT2_003735 [Lamellibrachia satsuma]|nr:hypothetical protein LSAT2_003735 [Lamellibrachia satsuma]